MPFYILHPKDLELVRKQRNAIVVDVRDGIEYHKWHYQNAVRMPYNDSEKWLQQFYRGQTYILYCDYGNVSLMAARKLAQRGITAYSVLGGAKELKRYTG